MLTQEVAEAQAESNTLRLCVTPAKETTELLVATPQEVIRQTREAAGMAVAASRERVAAARRAATTEGRCERDDKTTSPMIMMEEEHERVVRQLREEHTKQLAGVQEEKEALKRAALRRTIHLRYQKEEEARSYALALEAARRVAGKSTNLEKQRCFLALRANALEAKAGKEGGPHIVAAAPASQQPPAPRLATPTACHDGAAVAKGPSRYSTAQRATGLPRLSPSRTQPATSTEGGARPAPLRTMPLMTAEESAELRSLVAQQQQQWTHAREILVEVLQGHVNAAVAAGSPSPVAQWSESGFALGAYDDLLKLRESPRATPVPGSPRGSTARLSASFSSEPTASSASCGGVLPLQRPSPMRPSPSTAPPTVADAAAVLEGAVALDQEEGEEVATEEGGTPRLGYHGSQAWRILELHTYMVGLQDLQAQLLKRLGPADAVPGASPAGSAAYVAFEPQLRG
eukprot:Transcript_7011.p1 GENE.Transcript_7011~~Transcript_7011.p1  ORF type:complete len:541 (+),score=104.74 Transcript_7011:245-1624(+)